MEGKARGTTRKPRSKGLSQMVKKVNDLGVIVPKILLGGQQVGKKEQADDFASTFVKATRGFTLVPDAIRTGEGRKKGKGRFVRRSVLKKVSWIRNRGLERESVRRRATRSQTYAGEEILRFLDTLPNIRGKSLEGGGRNAMLLVQERPVPP